MAVYVLFDVARTTNNCSWFLQCSGDFSIQYHSHVNVVCFIFRTMYTAQAKNDIGNNSSIHHKCHWYPAVRKEDVTLSQYGLPVEQRESVWNQQLNYTFAQHNRVLGFQVNLNIDSEKAQNFIPFLLNNAGDPFSASSLYAVNTKVIVHTGVMLRQWALPKQILSLC